MYSSCVCPNIGLALIAILVFRNVINCNFLLLWDDAEQVVNNPDIKKLTWTNIVQIFSSYYVGMYQPVTTLTFMLDYQIWGLSTIGFHISNLLFHILVVFVVFKLLYKLSENYLGSIIFAIIFAIHPLQVETVAWISARSNIMYSLFYLLGLLVYIKYATKSNYKYLIYTFLFFVLSALSKSAAITFPVILILFDLYYSRKLSFKIILEKIPFFIISIILGLSTIDARIQAEHISDLSVQFSKFEMLLVVTNSLIQYLARFLIPVEFSAFFTYPIDKMVDLPIMYYIAPVLLLIVISKVIYYQNKEDRRKIVFGILFF